MPRQLDTRLDREEGRRTAGAAEQGAAAIRRRHLWRAEAAMGAVVRSALARAGVDAALATRLCLADEAAAALLALPDTPELQRADSDGPAAAEAQASPGTRSVGPLLRYACNDTIGRSQNPHVGHCFPSVELVCSDMVCFAKSSIWWWPV
jgi:hypothetical protein